MTGVYAVLCTGMAVCAVQSCACAFGLIWCSDSALICGNWSFGVAGSLSLLLSISPQSANSVLIQLYLLKGLYQTFASLSYSSVEWFGSRD